MIRRILPGYFETMRIPLLTGRLPQWRDEEQDSGAAVVSRTLAEKFWPGQDPLGRRVYPDLPGEATPWYQIVGVVDDVLSNSLHGGPSELIYLARLSTNSGANVRSLAYVVRGKVTEDRLMKAARDKIVELDAQIPIVDFGRLTQIVDEARAPTLFAMSLICIAALVAVVLGGVGVYGVLSFLVSRRRGEIGIRLALGARRQDVQRMILGQSIAVAAVGIVVGLGGAVALTRMMSGLLFGVSPLDPTTYVIVVVALTAVVVVASSLPARRAAAVDPAVTLRGE